MLLCAGRRLALRHGARAGARVAACQRPPPPPRAAGLATKAPSASDILASPTWSVRALRGPVAADGQPLSPEPISPAQLRHLCRLAALPPPASKDDEDAMIATLQSQLQFVRAVQRVNTDGVEPLSAIRDETDQGVAENTVGLEELRHVLDRETLVGHYKRPTRVRDQVTAESGSDKWDALSTASRTAGRYFVVDSGSKQSGSS